MHAAPVGEALALHGVDRSRGLTEAEAERRLRAHGENVLPRVERRPAWLRFALELHNPLVYTLLAATVATYAVGEPVDASVILAVVLANAVIGYLQETRAEQALDALTRMVTVEAEVVRGGRSRRIPARLLVPGDVVTITAGDKVAADLRLLDAPRLEVDESALTGESVPVVKRVGELPPATALGDRANMAFSGTLVTAGGGTGLVVATGGATELGRVHRLLSEAPTPSTPLTRKLARFARALTAGILLLAAATFVLGTARAEPADEMLVAAVALAVGAIPEGLPAAVTIALAIGVSRMARRAAIVRRLPAVETLGSTTVICTDKTGTLTRNEMTVTTVVAGGRVYEVSGEGYGLDGQIRWDGRREGRLDAALGACLTAAVLCGDGHVIVRDDEAEAVGDPGEAALAVVAAKAGIDREAALTARPRIAVVPFESDRRFMATVHRESDGRRTVFVKGAVERVLAMCGRARGADGSPEPLDADAIRAVADALGDRALRVIAVAAGDAAGDEAPERPEGLTLLGLVAMHDPPRPEAVAAVAACHAAGVEVKMITGDHPATAAAVARQVGLVDEGSDAAVITGPELQRRPDDELAGLAAATTVFARVSAEDKLRLVGALQSRGEVVAMTGDGVNDAPALRQADIGVAMGRGGTEVAREAADIVLTDDDFASIEAAVEEGRHTFDNLRKFVVWTLPTNFAEGLLILAAIATATTLPVLPVQVLWINMTTAVLLGLTLAFEPVEPGVMRRPPRRPSEPLVTRELVLRMALVTVTLLGIAFALFASTNEEGTAAEARTAAVNAFVAVQIVYLLSCRSLERWRTSTGLRSNPWLLAGIGAMIPLQAFFTYAPVMNDLFHTAPIDARTWLVIVGVCPAAWALVEVQKKLDRRRRSDGRA